MKTLILLFLAAVNAVAGPVYSTMVLNTGRFLANGQALNLPWWVNSTGRMILIKGILPWSGLDCYAIADITLIVIRASDKSIIYQQSWDHYAQPTGIQSDGGAMFFPSGDYMALSPGDSLVFTCRAQAFGWTPDWPGWSADPQIRQAQLQQNWLSICSTEVYCAEAFTIYFTFDTP